MGDLVLVKNVERKGASDARRRIAPAEANTALSDGSESASEGASNGDGKGAARSPTKRASRAKQKRAAAAEPDSKGGDEHVARVRKAIQNGTYTIDFDRLAERLVDGELKRGR